MLGYTETNQLLGALTVKDIPRAHALKKQMAVIRQMIQDQKNTKKGIDKKLIIALKQLKEQYDDAMREW